jgi:prophage antirepressor-like protein
MENNIQIFNNPSFGEVRVTELNGEPMFCLSDVCKVLGLTAKGVAQRLGDDVISNYPIIDNLGREQNAIFVNEDGLYDAILDSRKPEAKKFRKWVTSEVLPSIRKHGAYLSNEAIEKTLTDPDYLIKLANTLKEERLKRIEAESRAAVLQITNDEMKPKAEFADAVMGSSDAIDMRKAATTLNMGIGRNKLFELLREKGVLDRHNIPYQTYIDRGYFRTIESTYNKPDGSSCINIKTVIFQKGLDFIRKILNAA